MTTTFEKYKGTQRGNYCTLPTIDVEIIDSPRFCAGKDWIPPVGESAPGNRGSYGPVCNKPVHWDKDSKAMPGMGWWAHDDGSTGHHISPYMRCVYCGNAEPGTVHYRQEPYSDETSCDRCGGVDGRAIGD